MAAMDPSDGADLSTPIFRSLHEWEKYLRLYFPDIRLVGELRITNRELAELGRYIRNLIKRHGLTQGTQTLAKRYPCVFLVFLAHTAARNEERGFWDAVARKVGVPQSGSFFHSNHHWGRLFLDLVAKFGLETFADVDSGHKYVIPIRLHGGIPAYSLPDFFENVLLPAVQEPRYAGMDVSELIEQVLQRSAVQYFVDSPVRYFLQHGGETAQNFFGRCLKMARAWEQQGDLPSAQELDLPRYVVRTFQEFMEGHLQTPKGKRLRPPRLYLDPYDPETLFHLILPEEPVDADQENWRYCWHIVCQIDGKEHRPASIPVRVQRRGAELFTVREECWTEAGPGRLRLEFEAQNSRGESQIRGRWFFDLAPSPGEPPVLAFRSASGRFVRRNSALPRDVLWLMVPANMAIQALPQGSLETEARRLSGMWSSWKLEEWDLTGAQVLNLLNDESDQVHHSISVQLGLDEPHLSGESLLEQECHREESPLFIGKPPSLWVPRLTGQTPEKEMSAWRIQVRAEGHADPTPPSKETSLAELAARGACQVDVEGFLLPLATLLGDRPAGTYTVYVHGPRLFRSELSFRIWPTLSVHDLAPYYLPGPEGPRPVRFSIQTSPDHRVDSATEGSNVTVTTEAPGQHSIMVGPDATVAELSLIQARPGGTEIRLPLELNIPRLHWTVRLDGELLEWATRSISLPVDKLLQSHRIELILVWEGAQTAPQAKLLLRDTGSHTRPVLQEGKLSVPHHSNRASIHLDIFRDTLAAKADLSNFDLALSIEGTEDTTALPLLLLHRELGVSAALLEWTDAGTVHLHWEAPHRLRNRRVRIWSAWRPWESPREYAIPDEVGPEQSWDQPGSGVFELPDKLPLGSYWVAFRTAPEWEPLDAPPMPTEDSIPVECDQIDPKRRLKAIEDRRMMGKGSPFLAAFERAAIFHLQGNNSLRDREINTALEHLVAADPSHIVALYRWLQVLGSDHAAKLRVHMYRPKHLKRLFENDTSQDVIDAYMADFIDTEIIEPESAQLVLTHTHNPGWQAHGIAVLVKHTDTNDIQAIVERVRQGIFSESIGLDLLAENIEEALATLYHMSADPLRDKLLDALALRVRSPRVIRPGIWIRSEAGWGHVGEILVEGKPRSYLLVDEQGDPVEPAVLQVELPRTEEILEAKIDMERGVIRIEGAEKVFICTMESCSGFAARKQEEIRENHCKVAHQGLNPAFDSSPPEWHYRNRPVFTWDVQHYYA